jgi:hypothetical protein
MNDGTGAFTLCGAHEQTIVEPRVRRIDRRFETRYGAEIILFWRHRFAVRKPAHDVRLGASKTAIDHGYEHIVVCADEVARLHVDPARRYDNLPVSASGSDRSRKPRTRHRPAEDWNEAADTQRHFADGDGRGKFDPSGKAEIRGHGLHVEHCIAGAAEPVWGNLETTSLSAL